MRMKKNHKMLKINTLRTFFSSILGVRMALLTVFALSLLACSGEKNANEKTTECPPPPSLEYARNLKIGETCGERVAEIRTIVGQDTLTRRFALQKSRPRVVVLSSAQVGYMLRLRLEDYIVGVGDGNYIADSALYARVKSGEVVEVGNGPTLSLEKIMALKPDLVLNFATGGSYDDYQRIEALGLPLMLTSEWQEEHPLAKAEWIKLFGALFDVETLADSIYKQSKSKYLSSLASRLSSKNGGVAGVSPAEGVENVAGRSPTESGMTGNGNEGDSSPNTLSSDSVTLEAPSADRVQNTVDSIAPPAAPLQNDTLPTSYFQLPTKSCPRVLVGMSYGGTWYAPGGQSYTAQLIRDAGGCYMWAEDSSRELRFSLEQIIALADSVDIWINPGMFAKPDEILAEDPRVADIRAFKEKQVYQNDARKGPGGGNDFYESAVAQPEKVLEDFIWAINGGKDSEKGDGTAKNSRWYRNIFNF